MFHVPNMGCQQAAVCSSFSVVISSNYPFSTWGGFDGVVDGVMQDPVILLMFICQGICMLEDRKTGADFQEEQGCMRSCWWSKYGLYQNRDMTNRLMNNESRDNQLR